MRISPLAKLALVFATSGCNAAPDAPPVPTEMTMERAELALMSSLPIYWGEAAEFGDILTDGAKPGWVRGALERRFRLTPVDTLDDAALSGVETLLLAQPRALSGEENVALDAWVRRGGKLLLFADPMLTTHSRFTIGDKRRPQDVILLSPILTHWGLTLGFDEDQQSGERMVSVGGASIPVDLAGTITLEPASPCKATAAVLARCRIGEGRVTILADAAVLDEPDEEAGLQARSSALEYLTGVAFD